MYDLMLNSAGNGVASGFLFSRFSGILKRRFSCRPVWPLAKAAI